LVKVFDGKRRDPELRKPQMIIVMAIVSGLLILAWLAFLIVLTAAFIEIDREG
jgi:hypothetical protein